ncbi:MAG TPA: hypothetical protein VIM58_06135 [Candidatus Methylacidiphilales bacterium]
MNTRLIPLFLILLLALPPGAARSQGRPIPKPPYVAPLPASGHWQIRFKKRDDGGSVPAPPPAPATDPVTMDFIKVGPFLRATVTYADGHVQQNDLYGNVLLDRTESGWHRSQIDLQLPPYPYFSGGFVLTDWLGPDTFKEGARYGSAEAFHYLSDDREAWIAAGTGLPLAVRKGNAEGVYRFLDAPTGLPPCPPEEVDLIRALESPIQPAP